MIKSPITNQGKIRYIELIKISILIWFFYALVSSVIIQNYHVIMLCAGTLTTISFGLGALNIVLISLSIIDVLKEYTDQKLFIWLANIKQPSFNSIKTSICKFIELFVVMNFQKSNMVVRC